MIKLYVYVLILWFGVCGVGRAVAVWSSRKRQIKMRTAVALSIGIGIYSIGITLVSVIGE